MKNDLVNINLYFPKTVSRIKNKSQLVDLIMKMMRKDGNIRYAGYLKEKDLKKELLRYTGDNINKYRELSSKEKVIIKKTIIKTIQKCHKKLFIPTKNFIFIFPWFPSIKEREFQGSFGFAAYSCVLHLFIAPNIFTKKSIADSVAHEINHSVSFFHHFDRYGKWSLLDHIINEGLAENFREDVLKTKPAPWAIALTKKEAFHTLKSIKHLLYSKKSDIQREILSGSRNYKRWTGYSIGYWLLKDFREKNKNLSWEEIIKIKPEDILTTTIKNMA